MTSEMRQQKTQDRIEKKIRSSRIIKELQAEIYEGPEEIVVRVFHLCFLFKYVQVYKVCTL